MPRSAPPSPTLAEPTPPGPIVTGPGAGPLLRPWPAGRYEVWLAAAALAARLLFWFPLLADPQRAYVAGDGRDYMGYAANLLAEGRMTLHSDLPLQADYARTPVYPLLLAGILALARAARVPAELGVAALQCLLSTWACIVAYRLARRLWPGRGSAAMAAAAWLALDPSVAVFGCQVMTEIPFMTLWVAATACIAEACHRLAGGRPAAAPWLAACLLLSLAALTRPIGLGAIAPAALCWLLALRSAPPAPRRRGTRGPALGMAGAILFALPLAGWSLRNRLIGGPFALSSVAPFNLLLYAQQLADPSAADEAHWQAALAEAQRILKESPDPAAACAEMAARGRARLLAEPLRLARAAAAGLVETALSPAYEIFPFLGIAPARVPSIAGPTALRRALELAPLLTAWRLCLMLWAGAGVGLALAAAVRHARQLPAMPALAFVLLLAVGHALLGALSGGGRFRVPIAPLIAILAAGAAWGGGTPSERRVRSRAGDSCSPRGARSAIL